MYRLRYPVFHRYSVALRNVSRLPRILTRKSSALTSSMLSLNQRPVDDLKAHLYSPNLVNS